MLFFDKVKNSLVNRAAECMAASLTALLLWVVYQVSPALIPAIETVISKKVLLALLAASIILNILFFLVVLSTAKKDSFRLKYGIYWDMQKNPHCPSCKTPLAAYGDHQLGGVGYRCIPCKKVFPLTKYLNAESTVPQYQRSANRVSKLEPYKPYIHQRISTRILLLIVRDQTM